jgi:hypothetical protein
MRYLSKTETNELLDTISKDNETYGLIFKLMYLYGKPFKNVITLKWEDINMEDSTISFKGESLPLSKDIKEDLEKYFSKEHSAKYIFLEDTDRHDVYELTKEYRKKAIYYFNNNIKQLELPSNIKYCGLSLTDLRRLRGQHLLLDGVDLNIVMKLYQKKPSARTQFKKYMQYDDLYKINNPKCETIEDVFRPTFTDLNIFELKEFDNTNQYIVTNMKESTLIVLDTDRLAFIEETSKKFRDKVIDIYKNNNLLENINGLQTSQYKWIDNCKFIKV